MQLTDLLTKEEAQTAQQVYHKITNALNAEGTKGAEQVARVWDNLVDVLEEDGIEALIAMRNNMERTGFFRTGATNTGGTPETTPVNLGTIGGVQTSRFDVLDGICALYCVYPRPVKFGELEELVGEDEL